MATYSITIYTGRIGHARDAGAGPRADPGGADPGGTGLPDGPPGGLDGGGDGVPDVHVTLFGSKASSPELRLGGPLGSTADLPASRRFPLADLGDIQRVRVRHDDTGIGLGCYLDRVVVQVCGSLQEWTFLCQRWLGRRAEDGAVEQTLDAVVA